MTPARHPAVFAPVRSPLDGSAFFAPEPPALVRWTAAVAVDEQRRRCKIRTGIRQTSIAAAIDAVEKIGYDGRESARDARAAARELLASHSTAADPLTAFFALPDSIRTKIGREACAAIGWTDKIPWEWLRAETKRPEHVHIPEEPEEPWIPSTAGIHSSSRHALERRRTRLMREYQAAIDQRAALIEKRRRIDERQALMTRLADEIAQRVSGATQGRPLLTLSIVGAGSKRLQEKAAAMVGLATRTGIPERSRLRCERWWKRFLRAEGGQVQEQLALIAREVGVRHDGRKDLQSFYISAEGLEAYKARMAEIDQWMSKVGITDKRAHAAGADAPVYPLLDIARKAASSAMAQTIATAYGIRDIARELNYLCFMITFTAPSRFHMNPTTGSDKLRDTSLTPKDSSDFIMAKWRRLRSLLAHDAIPHLGFWGQQPHKDGCAHLHIVIFVPPGAADAMIEMVAYLRDNRSHNSGWTREMARQEGRLDYSRDHPEIRIDEISSAAAREKGVACADPITYALRYVVRGVAARPEMADMADAMVGQADDGPDATLRIAAWASRWQLRRFDFFGLEKGTREAWKQIYSHPTGKKLDEEVGAGDPEGMLKIYRAMRQRKAGEVLKALGGYAAKERHAAWEAVKATAAEKLELERRLEGIQGAAARRVAKKEIRAAIAAETRALKERLASIRVDRLMRDRVQVVKDAMEDRHSIRWEGSTPQETWSKDAMIIVDLESTAAEAATSVIAAEAARTLVASDPRGGGRSPGDVSEAYLSYGLELTEYEIRLFEDDADPP